ncbi:MAG: CDGSH iron-sulfur domain-containing protein [Fimbriimonadaceae bacterium]
MNESSKTSDTKNTVNVVAAGPLRLCGEICFLDPNEAVVFTEVDVELCRCGKSKNKPFCDDSHVGAGFAHVATTLDGKYGEAATEPAPLNVEPLLNGPLFLTGAFQIIASDGKTVCEGNKTALCRCGLSENKPFCDGSHREGGFEAPVLG